MYQTCQITRDLAIMTNLVYNVVMAVSHKDRGAALEDKLAVTMN